MEKRKIEFIVIHCTASHQTATVESILRYFSENLKWSRPGYHYLVRPDGVVVNIHPEEEPSNGVKGFNGVSVNVAYIGGIDLECQPVDNRTDAQRKSLKSLVMELKRKYPDAVVQGHRDFEGVRKACPCFDAIQEYKQ